jgi:3-hydroxyacyl-CoA dehydrogenase
MSPLPLLLTETRDSIAVVRINNPPVNALTTGVPQGVAEAVQRAEADPSVHAIIVIGQGRTFAAGADINEFVRYVAGDGPMPEFHRWLNAIENCSKPVVMAIHGQAFGAGLELAMAGHYRVMAADAQVGQPEVKIGLIPGAGGTVRLPRLVGVLKAAEMCSFGEPLSARDALAAGIVDRVIEGDLLAGAVAFALQQTTVRRTGELPVSPAPLDELRKKVRKHLDAPLAALEAIERTSALSFEEGCKAEAEIFTRLMHGDQCKSLIHAFFAERAVAKVPGIDKDTPAYPIREAAVIGAGTMGCGIAMALANAGLRVRLKDTEQAAVDRGVATIRKNYERSKSLTPAQREERMARITGQTDDAGFNQADIIVEAVFESLALKQQVFAEMDRVAKPECLLATNTSTLDIDRIAAATKRPHMVLGTHFFSPASVMRLLEIVRGRATSPSAIATAMALAKSMKKVGVVVGNGFGFVGNRLFIPYMNEAEFLVEEGATPEQVDRVLTEFGMAMGPFAVADLSGLDVFMRIREERANDRSLTVAARQVVEDVSEPRRSRSGLPNRETVGLPLLHAQGRYGQKTGAGWFQYGADRKPIPEPAIATQIQQASGRAQRAIPDEEIRDRCIFALVNEGARVLEEGIATRASDIDVVYLTGYGFPAHRGGPMFYADTVGLPHALARVREFGWQPAELLKKLADEKRRFSE